LSFYAIPSKLSPPASTSVGAHAAVVKLCRVLPNELKEPDFDALRGRADFQTLVAEVETRAERPLETVPMPGGEEARAIIYAPCGAELRASVPRAASSFLSCRPSFRVTSFNY
jgi:hypothetical protein